MAGAHCCSLFNNFAYALPHYVGSVAKDSKLTKRLSHAKCGETMMIKGFWKKF